ncbi:MAG: LysR family transcriptional regulator [Bdellovibrionales bacterium]|nr:LysR family transcriptional regulator [Bdellovibrionales bacterium]
MTTLAQIEYVLAVDKYRHFGKAAEACRVAQPTLSLQIQKLEDELGIIVFDRVQKPIVPTPEGAMFIEQAKVVLKEHQKLIQVSKTHKGEVSGEFHLGIIPTVSTYIIPLIVSKIAAKYPLVSLFIEELKTATILEDLKADRIDGAILATPTHVQGLKEHPLYYEPFYLYLSKNHPLLKKKIITDKDIDQSQLWMLQDGNCFKDQVANYCSLPDTETPVLANIHFQSGSLETLKHVVQKNSGYTMIPAMMADYFSSEDKKYIREFKTPSPTREISFVYRRDHWKIDVIDAIKKTVLEVVPNEMKAFDKKQYMRLDFC